MVTQGWVKVSHRFITSVLFGIVRTLFALGRRINWELNGTAKMLRESRDPRNYERSAHVVNVVLFHTFCEMTSMNVSDFIYVHNRFDSPQFIVDNDHVFLMNIENDRAIFVEAKEKDMRLWKSEVNSFMRFAQMAHHKRLIFVPLSAFHRVSDVIGDPKGELILLLNTARCGSTLICQVLEATGRCVTISEPLSPDRVVQMYRKKKVSDDKIRRLARDVIRWECRPYKTMQPPPLAYMLKLIAPTGIGLPLFKEVFPNCRLLFMYRDIVKMSKSLYRLSYQIPSIWLIYEIGRLHGNLTKLAMDQCGFAGDDYNFRLDNGLTLGVLSSAVTMKSYLDMRHAGLPISAVRYEELVGQPLDTCRRLLEYCGLPVDLAEQAVRGLDRDSHRNTPLDRRLVAHLPEPQLTEENKKTLNDMLRHFPGVPLIGEDCLLEGTLMVNA